MANKQTPLKKKQQILVTLLILFAFLQTAIPIFAQKLDADGLPARPNPPTLVTDLAGLLNPNEKATLEQKLRQFNDSSSNEIAVVTVPNMNGLEIEDYTYALGQKWKIGKAVKDNGILVLVSMAERKSRIEVGKGLEGAVPDLIAAEITRNVIKPAFKQQMYYEGLDAAADNLIAASKNEYQAEPGLPQGQGSIIPFIFLLFILFAFFIFLSRRRQKAGDYYMSRRGHRGWNDPWIGGFPSSGGGFFGGNSGSDFGGFSGGGGSDFGGFGGGSFGGGGASGDW